MNYRNFTDAFKEVIKGEKVLEVGPGIYYFPLLSILQNCRVKEYLLVDGALDYNDSYSLFNQVGGILPYLEKISEYVNNDELIKVTPIVSAAHKIPLLTSSVDHTLFFKSFCKVVDGGLASIRSLYNTFGKLSPSIYELLVLEEARRVSKDSIVIVPEGKLLEDSLIKDLEKYANSLGQRVEIIRVDRATLSIALDGKEVEVPHWQDNTNPSKVVINLEVKKEELDFERFKELFKRREKLEDKDLERIWSEFLKILYSKE